MTTLDIAIICHEANRVYCQRLGDHSQKPWPEAPQWQKDSAINGVMHHQEHPDSTPADSHNNWLAEKKKAGWVYGEVKDETAKTHPCIVPFEELPIEQQRKDMLFLSIVRALSS